jgi:hypothetical protein
MKLANLAEAVYAIDESDVLITNTDCTLAVNTNFAVLLVEDIIEYRKFVRDYIQ